MDKNSQATDKQIGFITKLAKKAGKENIVTYTEENEVTSGQASELIQYLQEYQWAQEHSKALGKEASSHYSKALDAKEKILLS